MKDKKIYYCHFCVWPYPRSELTRMIIKNHLTNKEIISLVCKKCYHREYKRNKN